MPIARGSLLMILLVSIAILAEYFGVFSAPWCRAEERVVRLKEATSNARGQIAIVTPDGERKIRITGFFKPEALSYTRDGRILVSDSVSREVVSITDNLGSFALEHTWKLPAEAAESALIDSSSREELLVIDKRGRLYRFSGSHIIDQSQPPAGISRVAGGVVLPDGTIVILRAEAQDIAHSLYTIQAGHSDWTPLSVSGVDPAEAIVPSGIAALGNAIYLWRGGDSRIVYGLKDGDLLNLSGKLSYPQPALVVPDSQGGVSVVSLNAKVSRFNSNSELLSEIQFINLPLSAAFDADRNALLLAHEYPVSEQWPQFRNRAFSNQEHPFAWDKFSPIALLALAFSMVWGAFSVRWGYERPQVQSVDLTFEKTRKQGWSILLALFLLLGALYGFYLAWSAQELLLLGLGKDAWLLPYLAGAVVVGLSCEVWRRWQKVGDEPKRFVEVLKEPAPALGLAYLLPLVGIAALSAVIYRMGLDRQYNGGYREAFFFAGIELALSLLIVDAWVCRRALVDWFRREWPFFIVPLLIGIFTLFFRLEDVPYNVHFDFTSHVFIAEQFLRGNKDGWWDWGFVPAPVIGSIPEILGLVLAGYNPFGYRFGSALFNLSAVLAVYLIGRVYRNPRVGFWAATILAGNTAFIHFGRLMSNGAAATIALWTIAGLTLALKYKRSSLWLFTGLVAGFAFYQWPVARVGVAAAGLMYLLVFLRLPVKQFKQLPHHLFGLAGFVLLVAPLICIWIAYPERFMPRTGESLTGVNLRLSNFSVDTSSNSLNLFFRSLGWIFSEYDRSSQGSVSPGFNSLEAVLFACGLVIMCVEGLSINILIGLMLVVTLLVCGAWAVGPPWYTRVLPSAPMACLIIARALEGLHNFVILGKKRVFWAVFVLISLGLLVISPYQNFKRYYNYETAVVRRNNLYPMNTIGRAIDRIGPEYSYVFLLLGEPQWRFTDVSSFAHMFPYISNLKLRESFDVNGELPVPADTPTAFLVQLKRFDLDLAVIKKHHPDAEVVPVEDINHDKVAYLVLVPGRKGRTS